MGNDGVSIESDVKEYLANELPGTALEIAKLVVTLQWGNKIYLQLKS